MPNSNYIQQERVNACISLLDLMIDEIIVNDYTGISAGALTQIKQDFKQQLRELQQEEANNA